MIEQFYKLKIQYYENSSNCCQSINGANVRLCLYCCTFQAHAATRTNWQCKNIHGWNYRYDMMTTIKLVELICAIAFLSGRFVPLAAVVIFPITVNILLFHAFLEPSGLPVSILLLLGNLFLAWNYRDRYKSLLMSV